MISTAGGGGDFDILGGKFLNQLTKRHCAMIPYMLMEPALTHAVSECWPSVVDAWAIGW